METNHQLLKKIARTRRGKSHLYPLLSSILIMAVFWIALWKGAPVMSHSMTLAISLLGLLTALLVYRLILRFTRRSLHQAAEELDDDLDAHNQLETMVELQDTQHPLRVPQGHRAEQELGRYKPAPWSLLLGLAGLLLCLELGGFVHQAFHFMSVEVEEPEIPPLEPPDDEFAELTLTKPESEIRMKPMDEVAWEAVGRSSNGFDDLRLVVCLNGDPVASYPIEGDPRGNPGEISLRGSFFLDELDATPYDVVSYHLVAHAEINDLTAKEVVSIPQFVEVRPFREDATVFMEGGMVAPPEGDDERAQMISILGVIHQVLKFELILNKAVFAARASGLPDDDPLLLEQIALLKQEQKQLKDTLNEFLASVNPERLTPNMTVSLRTAEQCMEAAALKLEQISPDTFEERRESP